MTATLEHRPAHPDLPLERAWKLRTRTYVSCGPRTRLRDALVGLGAHWDTKRKAYWVGPTKRTAALDAAIEAEHRARHVRETLAAGHWVTIPYEAEPVRVRARELGAVWHPESRRWAAPTTEIRDELLDLCEQWSATAVLASSGGHRADGRQAEEEYRRAEAVHRYQADRAYAAADSALQEGTATDVIAHLEDAVRARERAAIAAEGREQVLRRRQDRAIAAQRAAAARREDILAASGRTPLGRHLSRTEATTEIMPRHRAAAQAYRRGDVLRLEDGRRAVVTETRLRLLSGGAEGCPGNGDHSGKHWCYRYRLDLVRLTVTEIDAEVERGRADWDAHEIHQLMQWMPVLTQPRADDRWSEIEPGRETGRITVTTGVTGQLPAGHLIVTADAVIWQHPGEYDTYIRAEGITTDPGVVAWCRSVLDGGERRRVVPGTPPTYYTITRPRAPDA